MTTGVGSGDLVPPGPTPASAVRGLRPTVDLSKDEAAALCDVLWEAERALRARGWHTLGVRLGRWVEVMEDRLTAPI